MADRKDVTEKAANAASQGVIDAPKPDSILALEKQYGKTLQPYYAQTQASREGQAEDYGPPIGYSFENENGQNVHFDTSGNFQEVQQRRSVAQDLLPLIGAFAGATFLGPALNSLASSAGFGGTSLGASTGAINEAIASGMAPGSLGASALPGAMTAEQLAAAQGISAAGGAATPLASIANLTTPNVGALGSANEAIASGMAPGSIGAASAAGGALSPAELAAASGTTTLGSMAAPAAISANQAIAAGMAPGAAGAAAAAAGTLAPAELAAAQGVSTAGSATAGLTAASLASNPNLLKQLQDATGLNGTQLAALLSGGVNALTSANTSGAIGAGLRAQQDATKASQDVLKGVYNQQLGFQKPYQGAGTNAITQLGELGSGTYQMYDPVTGQPTTMGTGSGYLTHQFDKNDLAGGLAPNYDFMLQQGQMANQRAANVGGGALSGNTLQGLQNYTQNYAGNAYQNAFQNYQTQRNNIYNNLSNMAGIGQTANQGAGQAGANYGTGITGLNTGLANATAAAMLGQAQAAGGGANSLANSTFLASLLNQGKAQPTNQTTPVMG